jgi:hypothetical protein
MVYNPSDCVCSHQRKRSDARAIERTQKGISRSHSPELVVDFTLPPHDRPTKPRQNIGQKRVLRAMERLALQASTLEECYSKSDRGSLCRPPCLKPVASL